MYTDSVKKFASLREKKIVVTGAAGFIGSHLVEALLGTGAHVTALVHYNALSTIGNLKYIPNSTKHKNFHIVFGDTTDPFFCLNLLKNQHIVFHLAALIDVVYSYSAPKKYFEVNTLGTINLLDSAVRNKLNRFIHISSSEVYGNLTNASMDESHSQYARSPYAASKIGADQAVLSYASSFDVPFTIVRPFNAFGPRQSTRAIIPNLLTQLLSQNEKTVRVGTLSASRDFTYVTNTVAAIISASSNPKTRGEIINVGSNKAFSVQDIYDFSCKLTGINKPIIIDTKRTRPKMSEIEKQLCNNKKITQLCGWQPTISFEKGMSMTIEWIQSHLDTYEDQTTK